MAQSGHSGPSGRRRAWRWIKVLIFLILAAVAFYYFQLDGLRFLFLLISPRSAPG